MKSRIRVIQIIFGIWSFVLLSRLFYWQIVQSASLREQGRIQIGRSEILSASRGQILAQDGYPLATNIEKYRLFINPKILPKDLSKLEKILETIPASESAKENLSKARNSDASWFSIVSGLSISTKEAIDNLEIAGAGFDPQPERVYPEGTPSAYLTGFIGKDKDGQDVGYFGIEGYFDRQLKGIPGKRTNQADAMGLPILLGEISYIPPQNGKNIQTSIDRVVQHVAFEKLQEGLTKYQAESGTVTILDSRSGQVLAMSSLPGYDQKNYNQVESSKLKNPIVSVSYEPGSTFKTIIMSSGLDAQAVNPNSICTACSGPLKIGDYFIRNYDDKYTTNTNMFDIILHSDNVGMVFVGKQIGQKRMIEYLKKFGFGKLTGIELQEESISELRPENDWHEIDYATTSFGQGIAVTPLQLTAAVNVIANKGIYQPPRIVLDTPGKNSTRIISEVAAKYTTDMMVNGVKNGAVNIHRPKGFLVAGKTGTAQVPIEGHYDANKTIASFVGFAPANNPKFTMLVTISDPKSSPWGSTTAAPVWFAIAKELFRYYKIPEQTGL